MQLFAIARWCVHRLAVAITIAVLVAPVAEARPNPGDQPMPGDPVIAPPIGATHRNQRRYDG